MVEANDATAGMAMKPQESSGLPTRRDIAEAVPVVSDGVSLYDSVTGLLSSEDPDGADIALGVAGIATEVTGFVQSSADTIMDIASDPLGWLVGQGLDFLLSVVQPLQDAIHWVSGDGDALSTAAENFGEIAGGLNTMALDFARVADETLSEWKGEAANSARQRLAEFANGINGISAKSGDIAQMLQLSSMLMQFIEELIKAILTELITWLIMIWIPALAAAAPTFGGSTAAAGSATTVKATTTTTKTTQKVSKLQQILDKILGWLDKLREKLAGTKVGKFLDDVAEKAANTRQQGAVNTLFGESGSFGKRYRQAWDNPVLTGDGALDIDRSLFKNAATESLKAGGKAAVEEATGFNPATAGDNPAKAVNDHFSKVLEHTDDARTAADYGATGEESTDAEIRDALDI